MKHLLLLIFMCPFGVVSAQVYRPGGVSGAYIWEVTEFSKYEQAKWISRIGDSWDTAKSISGSGRLINSNPAFLVNDGIKSFSLNLGELDVFSFFTVCQENDTLSEKVILSLENDTMPEMVLTNSRMAAVGDFKYANFAPARLNVPKIYSYTQNKPANGATALKRLQFGLPPRGQSLPVSLYRGIVPELILFNRALSYFERQKVESYLALKYGITLNQEFPVSYLNSHGEVIWDAERNVLYNQHVAGVGRDGLSGLCQKVSENCESPGFLKISVLHDMADQTFLIWGDNGREPRFVESGPFRRMEREWKVSLFNAKSDSVSLAFDKWSIKEIKPLKPGDTFWLMIDRSATGKYPFKQTDFLKCSQNELQKATICFTNILFDADASGNDIFTLFAAPEFFARSSVYPSSCTAKNAGAVFVDIAGGRPPYLLNLVNSDLGYCSRVVVNENHFSFNGLNQGLYKLSVVDAENASYEENISISNAQPWQSNIRSVYKLEEGMSISLDASAGMPGNNYVYSWTTPNGLLVQDKLIQISQCGSYFLSVTDEKSCNSTRKISVENTGKASVKEVELYPNPTRGSFTARLELKDAADVHISISDMTGKVLRQTILRNDYYYLLSDELNDPGTYFLSITTGNEKETLKLVVQ